MVIVVYIIRSVINSQILLRIVCAATTTKLQCPQLRKGIKYLRQKKTLLKSLQFYLPQIQSIILNLVCRLNVVID